MIFLAQYDILRTRILRLHFGDCLQWNFNFIASDDPHSKCVKCLGFSHAREAVYGISKCKFCENLRLKTLRSRLEVLEKESSVFPRRTPEASAASRESATWGSDVETEAMESELNSV